MHRPRLLSILDSSPTLPHLHQALAHAITTNLWSDAFISSRFIAAAAATNLALAHLAFTTIPRPSAFAYTILIRFHSSPHPSTSLLLFNRMRRAALYPDRFVFPFLLRAATCSSVTSALHSLALRHGLAADPHIATSLLHTYSSYAVMNDALEVFDKMTHRTTVTWNAIISCCARPDWQDAGMLIFRTMLSEGVSMNADTVAAALSCCAGIGALALGRSLHGIAARLGVPQCLGTSLVHMYARCGCWGSGWRVFDEMEERDASAWTAMIGGLAMHGRGQDAVVMFERMVREGVVPDSVTFTSVLHACSHSGMVERGVGIFEDMKRVYGVEARMEHYGTMVDLLGRAGHVAEAERVVETMPFEPNRVVWGSLIRACLVKGGKELERRVLGLEVGEGGGFYVGVSNGYAEGGRWDEVERVRERMVEKGVRKEKGYSLVEVKGRMHMFLVGDTTHPLTEALHGLLLGMLGEMMRE